ncbi:MAG: hypothetical protein WCA46_13505, partial [Actinocatenispora sp.]
MPVPDVSPRADPRRRMLLTSGAAVLLAAAGCGSDQRTPRHPHADGDAGPATPTPTTARPRPTARPRRIHYGPGADQFGDLHGAGDADRLPAGRPVVVVLHGGFWQASYGLDLGAPLAADLAARGYLAWTWSTGGSAPVAAGRTPSRTSPPASTTWPGSGCGTRRSGSSDTPPVASSPPGPRPGAGS